MSSGRGSCRCFLHRDRCGVAPLKTTAPSSTPSCGSYAPAHRGGTCRPTQGCVGRLAIATSRFYRWTASVVWQKVLDVLQKDAEGRGNLDWSRHFVDGSSVRAHQHAAGARGGQAGESRGRNWGGFSTKFHVRGEGHGKPLALALSAGLRHESKLFETLMEVGTAEQAGRIASGGHFGCVVADKGYSHEHIRRYVAHRGILAVIPLRSDQGHDPSFDRETYRQRNKVDRLIGRLKQWRRIATRYDKRAASYLAMLTLALVTFGCSLRTRTSPRPSGSR